MSESIYTKEEVKRIILGSAVFCVSALLLLLNNLSDQYFVTFQNTASTQAYTLDVPFFWILVSASSALSIIYSSDVKRYLKNGDIQSANEVAIRAIVYALIFGLGFAVLTAVVSIFMFNFFAEDEVANMALTYLTPLLSMYFVLAISSVLGGLLNAQGKTRYYLFSLFLMFATNVMFDYFFVLRFGWGLFGNGLGTICGALVSMIVCLFFFLTGKTQITLRLRNFSWSRQTFADTAIRMRPFLSRQLVKYIAELCIRFTVYVAYSLSYGIPMLFSALISVLAVGTGAFLSKEYETAYIRGDQRTATQIFTRSMAIMVPVLILISMVMFFCSDELARIYTSNGSMGEKEEIIIWTMCMLCVSAPFNGIRYISNAVSAQAGRLADSTLILLAWESTKVAVIYYLSTVDYVYVITAIVIERILAGSAGVVMAFWHIKHSYKPKVKASDTTPSV